MTYTVQTKHNAVSFESNAYFYFWPHSRKRVADFCDRISRCINAVMPEAMTADKIKVKFCNQAVPANMVDGYEASIYMQYAAHWHFLIMRELTTCALIRAKLPMRQDDLIHKWYPAIQEEYRRKYGALSLWWNFGDQYK